MLGLRIPVWVILFIIHTVLMFQKMHTRGNRTSKAGRPSLEHAILAKIPLWCFKVAHHESVSKNEYFRARHHKDKIKLDFFSALLVG